MSVARSSASLLQTETHRRGVLGLYRTILRVHRRRLPQTMRDLGDAFVSQEFRLHKNVQDEEVVAAFLARWREYLVMLRSGEDASRGASLREDELTSLSTDQRQQLDKLRTTLFEEEKEKD